MYVYIYIYIHTIILIIMVIVIRVGWPMRGCRASWEGANVDRSRK